MTTRARLPITVLVQTKNEEVGIAACLEALKVFAQVIVVDSDSHDKTVEIAVALGAEVVNFSWNGAYPKKKQWQLENIEVQNEWLLFLDADESPTQALISELHRLCDTNKLDSAEAYRIRLSYFFTGKRLRFGHKVVKTALLKKGYAQYPVIDDIDIRGMGELEGHYQPVVKGLTKTLTGRLLHHDLDPVRTWFDRHNRYSDWESALRARAAVKATVSDHRSRQGRLFDKIPAKPMFFFMYSYFARLGFLDGRAGFDYALALSMYYWQISLKTRELRRTRR